MNTERQIMQDYLDALVKRADYPAYFTDDIVATFEGTDACVEPVLSLHENLLTDEGKAAIEADFVGTHTGEFAGIPATGRAVRVPYSVVYDLRGDQISALRIYFPTSLLMDQLSS